MWHKLAFVRSLVDGVVVIHKVHNRPRCGLQRSHPVNTQTQAWSLKRPFYGLPGLTVTTSTSVATKRS